MNPTLLQRKDPFFSHSSLLLSGGLHLLLFLLLLTSPHFFSTSLPEYKKPSLRVELIALPSLIKKDSSSFSSPPLISSLNPPSQALSKTSKYRPLDASPPSSKNKKITDPLLAFKKKEAIKSKNQNALKRIQALEKFAGNQLSAGTHAKGKEKTTQESSEEETYYLELQEQLKVYWELPPWFNQKKLSAQVQIFFSVEGRLLSFQFTKSSGNADFDHYVEQAIKKQVLFPAPPHSLKPSVLQNGILVGFPL